MSGKGCASEAGIELIRAAMKRNGWTQAETAKECGFARSTLNQILAGQSVKLENLEELCHLFELEIGQVLVQEVSDDIDRLVQQLRSASAVSLRQRCGTMRILDMTQPVDTGAIYTDVNILEKVAGKSRAEISQLMQECGAEGFDRFFLGGVRQKRVPGFEAVLDKKLLMILGRPGAGKTTFLKRLAIECLNGTFLADRLPVFVTLKEFAEAEGKPGIVDFMGGDRASLMQVLATGKALILLDGLDEVMEKDHDRVIRGVDKFAEEYSQNHIVITCRIAAQEYIFRPFTDVEMADFDDEQIQMFADKWFKTTEKNPVSTTGKMFWKELESRKPVKELGTNPLLLTLLCLSFEYKLEFPKSRFDLLERGVVCLLETWDKQRDVNRDELYRELSLTQKELLLGQLAMYMFERGDYFFKERVAAKQIKQYFRGLSESTNDPEALLVDGRKIMKSVESQHGLLIERAIGIYSFSHLTFHEYFTAKNILDLSNPAAQEAALGKLVEHISEQRWKEVFLLVAEGLDNADHLLRLMKERIESMVINDPKLQQLLEWIMRRSRLEVSSYKPAAIRAYYHARMCTPDLKLSEVFEFNVSSHIDVNCSLARSLDDKLAQDFDYIEIYGSLDNPISLDIGNFDFSVECTLIRLLAGFRTEAVELEARLQDLQNQFPDSGDDVQFQFWLQHDQDQWTYDYHQIMGRFYEINRDWQFIDEQNQKLQQYYDANLLLAQCLNSECYISREVREEIEETMLMPMAEIERWKRENRGGVDS